MSCADNDRVVAMCHSEQQAMHYPIEILPRLYARNRTHVYSRSLKTLLSLNRTNFNCFITKEICVYNDSPGTKPTNRGTSNGSGKIKIEVSF
jgi:hypothetical protein